MSINTQGRNQVRLTPREHELLCYMAGGHTSRETAAKLGISFRTAQTHGQSILTLYHVHTKAAAVAMALATGDLIFQDIEWR